MTQPPLTDAGREALAVGGKLQAMLLREQRFAAASVVSALCAALVHPAQDGGKTEAAIRAEARREAFQEAVREMEARAERARVAAIGGGMDPSDATLLDYEYSNAAARFRALAVGDEQGEG